MPSLRMLSYRSHYEGAKTAQAKNPDALSVVAAYHEKFGSAALEFIGVNMQHPLSVSRAIELIGYPPTSTSVFAVEAIAEGVSVIESFKGVGRAFEEVPAADPAGESA
ncbi:hypothetical protein [Streptomyces sp. NPDC050416]|uniref:hypothetical protein n=1 Tax=Streptomyces sp. NPDC050416 TaxID=3365611 RepID=UPI00378E6B4D